MIRVKTVIVGDGAVGKTSALIAYATGKFPTEYVPAVFDNYSANIMLDGSPGSLQLWDTSGQEDYDRLRPLSYPNTDVFVVCYSIISPTSLQNVVNKWLLEKNLHCPRACWLLVGCKAELRKDSRALARLRSKGRATLVTRAEAEAVATEFGALKAMECSAKTGIGLKEVFDEAMSTGFCRRGPFARGRGVYSPMFKRGNWGITERCLNCRARSRTTCKCTLEVRTRRMRKRIEQQDRVAKRVPQTLRQWCRMIQNPGRHKTTAVGPAKQLLRFFEDFPGLRRLVGSLIVRYYNPVAEWQHDNPESADLDKKRDTSSCVIM